MLKQIFLSKAQVLESMLQTGATSGSRSSSPSWKTIGTTFLPWRYWRIQFLLRTYWKGTAAYSNRIRDKPRRGKLWFSDLPSLKWTKQVLVPWRYIFYKSLGLQRRPAPQIPLKAAVSAGHVSHYGRKKELGGIRLEHSVLDIPCKKRRLEPTPHWQESWRLC